MLSSFHSENLDEFSTKKVQSNCLKDDSIQKTITRSINEKEKSSQFHVDVNYSISDAKPNQIEKSHQTTDVFVNTCESLTSDIRASDNTQSLAAAEPDSAKVKDYKCSDHLRENEYREWFENERCSNDLNSMFNVIEFMQSIGLLTCSQYKKLSTKRNERKTKKFKSIFFNNSMWEKVDTKRKKRDWLPPSPPELRRKIRSNVNSNVCSRSSSPLENANHIRSAAIDPDSRSSSPPNYSYSPTPSPRVQDSVCPICDREGASILCNGCGVNYHSVCVKYDPNFVLHIEWLCPKCERLGLRSITSNTRVP